MNYRFVFPIAFNLLAQLIFLKKKLLLMCSEAFCRYEEISRTKWLVLKQMYFTLIPLPFLINVGPTETCDVSR